MSDRHNRHIGSDFDDFLKEEGLLFEVKEAAIERLIDRIENQEDISIALQILTELQNSGERPQQAGWLFWDDVKDEWDEE
ncbi:MAG: hypothetical protein AAGA60_26910 [Cyanobacteria bacterium P01_E01_bin.42]